METDTVFFSRGAVAGIAAGGAVAVVLIFVIAYVLFRRRHGQGRRFSWPGSATAIGTARKDGSGLRNMWLGQRYSRTPSRGEPGFVMIGDQEQDAVEYPYGNGRASVGSEYADGNEKMGGGVEYLPKVTFLSQNRAPVFSIS